MHAGALPRWREEGSPGGERKTVPAVTESAGLVQGGGCESETESSVLGNQEEHAGGANSLHWTTLSRGACGMAHSGGWNCGPEAR